MSIELGEFQRWVRRQYAEGEYRGLEGQVVNLLVSQVGLLGDAAVNERSKRVEEGVARVIFLVVALADKFDVDVSDALMRIYPIGQQ